MTRAGPGVRLLVRTNIEYSRMDEGRFAEQREPTKPVGFILHAAEAGYLPIFRETFGMDFFAYRARMKALGEEGLAGVPDVAISRGFDDFDAWMADPGEEVVFPIDDDDVFSPGVVPLASRMAPDAAAMVWEHAALGYPGGGLLQAVHRYRAPLFLSNNWGIRKSFLQAIPKDDARAILAHHDVAQRSFLERAGREIKTDFLGVFSKEVDVPDVQFIEGHYGLQFFHPGSLYALAMGGVSTGIRPYLETIILSRVALPPELEWAEHHVEKYWALMAELEAGRARRTLPPS